MPEHFSAPERRALERSLAAGLCVCPRCGSVLDRHEVPPRTDVSYVRDRIWLLCAVCGATAVVDRDRIERLRGTDAARGADPGAEPG